jgi:transposase
VIAVAAGVRVLVATRPVDFRRGADSLAALVREQLRHDQFSGTIFIFRPKRADRLKILAWDGSGRPGVVLEAAGTGRLPLAADQRQRDAIERIAAGCARRRHGLVPAARYRRAASDRDFVRTVTN